MYQTKEGQIYFSGKKIHLKCILSFFIILYSHKQIAEFYATTGIQDSFCSCPLKNSRTNGDYAYNYKTPFQFH